LIYQNIKKEEKDNLGRLFTNVGILTDGKPSTFCFTMFDKMYKSDEPANLKVLDVVPELFENERLNEEKYVNMWRKWIKETEEKIKNLNLTPPDIIIPTSITYNKHHNKFFEFQGTNNPNNGREGFWSNQNSYQKFSIGVYELLLDILKRARSNGNWIDAINAKHNERFSEKFQN